MKKQTGNRILIIFLLIMLIFPPLNFIDTTNATGISIDSSSGITTATAYCKNRKLARGQDGTLYVTYLRTATVSNVFFANSTDGGVTWSTPKQITTDTAGSRSNPAICIDSNETLHIAYYFTKSGYLYLNYTYSTDKGNTWSTPVNINGGTSSITTEPSLAVDSHDTLYCFWAGRYSGGPAVTGICYKTCNPTTHTWSSITQLNSDGASEYPSICIDNSDNVYLSWSGYHAGSPAIYQIRFKKYTYATSTWSATTNITNCATAGRNSEYSSIVTDGTIVHLFFEGRNDTAPHGISKQMYYKSYNGAWSAVYNLTDQTSDLNYPSASITADGTLYVVYYGINSGETRNIFYNYKTLAGAWSSKITIIADSTEDRNPNMIYANYPYVSGLRTNRPKTGFALVWTANTTVKYFSSPDLTWDGSITVNSSISVVLHPDGDTYPQDFEVCHGATHDWDAVDDLVCDLNYTYISATYYPPIYEYDVFTMSNVTVLPSMLSINNVTFHAWFKKPNASSYKGDFVFFVGAMGYTKGEFALTTAWTEYIWTLPTNPNSGLPWTWTDINSMTAGVMAHGPMSCSQFYAVVNYSSVGYMVPTINFATGSTNDGTQYFTNHINANLTSISGSNGTHYVALDLSKDILLWERFELTIPHDSSTHGNDGTITSGAYRSSVNGKFGKYYIFSGENYITVPTSSSLNAIDSTATISLWANSSVNYSAFPLSNRALGGFWHDANNRIYWCIDKTGRIELINKLTGASSSDMFLSSALPSGFIKSWHHYVFVFTSTNVSLYLDGNYTGSSSFTSSMPNLNSLLDGFTTDIARGSRSSGYGWIGSIDDYIIFDRALNLTEVKALYDANVTKYNVNHTNLSNGNYTFTGYAVNNLGYMDSTEERWTNISKLLAPTITLVSPSPNGTTTATPWTICQVRIDDTNPGDTIHAIWQENSTGSWVTRQAETGISPGDTITWTYDQAHNLSTKYWFRIWANDTVFNSSATFCFTIVSSYSFIKGLPNGTIEWDGLPGTNNWCNNSGTYNETMDINITAPLSDVIYNVGVWVGDLSLTYPKLLVKGWNHNISFPSWVISACPTDSPEDVFSSVLSYIHDINGTDAYGTHVYWNYTNYTGENTTNTLIHILPGYMYDVFTTNACTVQITSDTILTASNISMQCSSDNVTWGTNSKAFVDGGNEIKLNFTTWNNVDGCYGANPFLPIISGRTQDIYCRFKLDIPLYMPSDQSYLSLSATNWKIYIYSNLGSGVVLPPTVAPSLPASGYFQLKWQTSLATMQFFATEPPVTCDINGDGVQEIFWSGRANESATDVGVLVCLNGTTGAIIWRQTFDTGYGPTNAQGQFPCMVYDFDKDGNYEITNSQGSNTICRDASTGTVKWNTTIPSGWHEQAYIDYGSYVTLYIVGGNYIHSLYGTNGTLIHQTIHYYTCWSGISIGDINGDGKMEILCGGRKNGYGGGVYGGLRVYDEDLNLLWSKDFITDSSECPSLHDFNGDGILDVFAGDQEGASSSYYVFDGWGNELYHSPSTGFHMHVQDTEADIDGDGHLELICGDYGVGLTKIWDMTTHAFKFTFPENYFYPPDAGNVIPDSDSEMIATPYTHAMIYKYNHTTSTYQIVYTFPNSAKTSVVTDIDNDGYNELLLAGHSGIQIYETNVPSSNPLPITNINYYGVQRLNDGLYHEPPYYNAPFSTVLSFGGSCYVTTLSPTMFIISLTSSEPLVEYNGFYNKGDYTTWLNATVYMPTGWTLNRIFFRIMNGATLYENITTGFIPTNINSTYKSYCRFYNPTAIMNGVMNCNVNVFVDSSYNGIPLFEGSKTFNSTFSIYKIGAPHTGSSKYNTTSTALDLYWTKGNYTDLSVVVRKTGASYPTSPTDGTVVQNSTAQTFHDTGVLSSQAYAIFGYNATTRSYSSPLNIPWGAIRLDVHDENNATKRIRFNLLISNRDGSQTYTKSNIIGPYYIDLLDIPYGPQTIFILSNTTYRQRTYYEDLYANTFYNFSFYLPPITPGGGSTPEENQTQLYLFTVYNRYSQTLQDVKIDVRRYISTTDSYESVGILLTDAAGQADIFLIPYKLYQFIVSKNGFITATSYWTPTPLIQTHTFILDYELPVEPTTINPFDVITFTAGFPTNNVTLTVDVDDSTGNLTDATIYIYENSILIYSIDFSSTPFHLDYMHNATSPNNNLSEYTIILAIRNHSEFPNNGNYNFTIIIQKSISQGKLLLNLDIDLTGILGDPGSGIGAHVGWINIFILGLGVFVIVSFGRYWAGIGIAAMGLVIGLIEFAFGLPGFTGIQLVSFIAYCIIMGALVEIGKAKQGRVGY